jgi:hypothetical protein
MIEVAHTPITKTKPNMNQEKTLRIFKIILIMILVAWF